MCIAFWWPLCMAYDATVRVHLRTHGKTAWDITCKRHHARSVAVGTVIYGWTIKTSLFVCCQQIKRSCCHRPQPLIWTVLHLLLPWDSLHPYQTRQTVFEQHSAWQCPYLCQHIHCIDLAALPFPSTAQLRQTARPASKRWCPWIQHVANECKAGVRGHAKPEVLVSINAHAQWWQGCQVPVGFACRCFFVNSRKR